MSQKPRAVWSDLSLFGMVFLLMMACAFFHLKSARDGHPIYRDQHIGTALEYYKHGINLLKPVIIGFNAENTPTPLEFPIWQAMTAIFFKMFGPWFGWGNLVSLLCTVTAFYPLYRLAHDFAGNRVAAWTLIFFLAQPVVFIMAGKAGTDGFSETTQIWYLYFATRLLAKPGILLCLAASFFAALCAVSKLPFYLAASAGLALLLVMRHRHSFKAWVGLALVGAVSGAVFLAWTRYTDRCIGEAKLIFVDLRMSNKDMVAWYFGDLNYRLDPANWVKGGWRMLNCCFGSFVMAALPLYAILFVRNTLLPCVLVSGCAVTTAIFTHLVLHHQNYYLMLTPPVAILSALAAADLERRIVPSSRVYSRLAYGFVVVLLGLSLMQGMVGMKVTVDFDPFDGDMATLIAEKIPPNDKILIYGGGWGGNVLMLADRAGLSIPNTKFLEKKENLDEVRRFGYTKLVMLSESPRVAASQMINPGGAHYHRMSYDLFLSPVAKTWPVVFQNDDILIKEIPKE